MLCGMVTFIIYIIAVDIRAAEQQVHSVSWGIGRNVHEYVDAGLSFSLALIVPRSIVGHIRRRNRALIDFGVYRISSFYKIHIFSQLSKTLSFFQHLVYPTSLDS